MSTTTLTQAEIDALPSSVLFDTKEDYAVLITFLRLHGIVKVEAEFSGSGDNGQVDDVSTTSIDGTYINIDNLKLTYPRTLSVFNTDIGTWEMQRNVIEQNLTHILDAVAYKALADCKLSWCQDDGGQGLFTMDFSVSPPIIALNIGINRIETTKHVFHY